MSQFTFETTPKIICEQGAAKRLGEIARDLGMSRVFLVTDIGLTKAGLIDGALTSLSDAGVKVTVFSDVLADPPEVSVQAAVQAAIAVGADGVIGFGGYGLTHLSRFFLSTFVLAGLLLLNPPS